MTSPACIARKASLTSSSLMRRLIMPSRSSLLTLELSLCWVHEGRLYKKLFPYVAQHQKLLESFLGEFWDFYRELLVYRRQPTLEERTRLEAQFDMLFTTKTGYWALDERIVLTRAKKEGTGYYEFYFRGSNFCTRFPDSETCFSGLVTRTTKSEWRFVGIGTVHVLTEFRDPMEQAALPVSFEIIVSQ